RTPVIAGWLLLSGLGKVVSGGTSRSLFASGTCAAVFLVSTLPWAATIALPRFSGGIGWLLVAITAATTFTNGVIGTWTISSTRPEELVWSAWSFLIYPIGALGQHLAGAELVAVVPALAIAVGTMLAACRWVAHRDVPLEAAQ